MGAPALLVFLNGNDNTAEAPNENYARELLELFTIGRGPEVGPGDYTNYTEEDIRAMSKILTGWRDYGYNSTETGEFGSRFRPARHSREPVTLSHRFDNATINFTGPTAHEQLTDFILKREEVSRFMMRNLYRWFVYYEITDEVEANVIEPLARQFREGDYEIAPVVRTLLSSNHFYATDSMGPMIRHPYDFVAGTLKALDVDPDTANAREEYNFGGALQGVCTSLGMSYFTIPNVAGWKAFYQAPLYYRDWINSATLQIRRDFTNGILTRGIPIQGFGTYEISLVDLIAQFPDPSDLPALIDNLSRLLFPRPITEAQREYLMDLVIPGLPETQWTVEYQEYLANPNDATIRAALETKLRRTVRFMLTMPEAQLS